ncbi:MAG: ABC transporter permease [Candidatus Sungbacteria bacterium]|nr:ABC transporter permease [Candidatus Sungbacteria bacterium]
MKFADALRTAGKGLSQNKTRSSLTMLGIVIGIASVILLTSIGKSAERLILDQVQSIGSNLVFIIPGATKGSRYASPPSVQGVVIKTLTKRDTEALSREPAILSVAPEVRGQARAVSHLNDATITYSGVSAEFFSIRNFDVSQGASFTASDTASFNRVAVLGSEIAKILFGAADPVGKTVRIKDITFRVLGVLEPKGLGPFGVDQDNIVLVPVTVAQSQMLGIDYYNVITVEAKSDYDVEFVKSRVISVLRQTHHITDPDKDDFTIRTQEDALVLLGNITSILTIFLTSIASISLVVGGIGIMNIMLVSVVERTREIGLRKAVGASNSDILLQFLLEALLLTAIGGLVGIFLGGGVTFILSLILKRVLPTGWVFALPVEALFLAVGVALLTGLVFGIYPARKAAGANPIDSLRYE